MKRAAMALWASALITVIMAQGAAVAADNPAKKAPVSIAILDFELIDSSLEGASRGVDEAETKRLVMISDLLRDLLAASGNYKVIDLAPAEAKIADAGLIHGCNGCEISIARSLGAERVMTGSVQKVSTLILSIQMTERDVSTGGVLKSATAQIRGNTDQSWTRGVKWLVRNRLLARK